MKRICSSQYCWAEQQFPAGQGWQHQINSTVHRSPASRKRRRKGNPVVSDETVMYGYKSFTLRLTVSQSICLGVEPTLWTFDQILLLFKCFGLKFVVLSLWGALSDDRPGLSFVIHSLVICLCVNLLFTFLSFKYLPYTLYNTYNIYKASFSHRLHYKLQTRTLVREGTPSPAKELKTPTLRLTVALSISSAQLSIGHSLETVTSYVAACVLL
jgi:hypothetical protein